VFRQNGRYHPAWGTMIQAVSKRMYHLVSTEYWKPDTWDCLREYLSRPDLCNESRVMLRVPLDDLQAFYRIKATQ